MSEEEKKAMENDILFQIDMELYDKFNDKFCKMNEYLGEIYSYADLKDLEDSRNATEINLLRQAIKKQQKELEQEKEKNKELEEENKNYKIINETLNNICNSLEKSQKFLNNEFEEINKKVKELRIDKRRCKEN